MVHRSVMAVLGDRRQDFRLAKSFASCPLPLGRDLLVLFLSFVFGVEGFSLFCLVLVLFVGC